MPLAQPKDPYSRVLQITLDLWTPPGGSVPTASVFGGQACEQFADTPLLVKDGDGGTAEFGAYLGERTAIDEPRNA